MPQTGHATLAELSHVPEDGKAEIINGELVLMPPAGFLPSRSAGAMYCSLHDYARCTRSGYAITSNTGFLVNLPNRQSFSPDAAFYTGVPTGMKFLTGAPIFAVEVRSENDYGPQAEREMAEKRRDYFAAGTLVVWDVDLLSVEVVKVYRATDPENPTVYRRGKMAEAEPAVPGWRMPVDELFV